MATPKAEQAAAVTQEQDDLELAFDIIADAIKKGHRFTNAQKNMGVRLCLDAINEEQQKLLMEAAEAHDVSLWIAVMAQVNRAIEWGVLYDLLILPEWREMKDPQ